VQSLAGIGIITCLPAGLIVSVVALALGSARLPAVVGLLISAAFVICFFVVPVLCR
jgi:hypothetical protein